MDIAIIIGMISVVIVVVVTLRSKSGQEEEIVLTEEFKEILHILDNTNQSIFISGKAGTGKSTLLKYFTSHTKKKYVVLAPTGIAAMNVKGQTIHSFFKFPGKLLQLASFQPDYKGNALYQQIEIMVIDEVSMVSANLMEGIDRSLRLNRNRPAVPFGGVQMVFIGDLFQLPPVVKSDLMAYFRTTYGGIYFFDSPVFKTDFAYNKRELTHIFRQKDADFKDILNRVRVDKAGFDDFVALNARHRDNAQESNRQGDSSAVFLTTTNSLVKRINKENMEKLTGKAFIYEAELSGTLKDDFERWKARVKSQEITASDLEGAMELKLPGDVLLTLKTGAQVMMIKNDSQKRWVNGSVGIVSKLDGNAVVVRIGGKDYAVEREEWEEISYQYEPVTREIKEVVRGRFRQYPLKLAWAMTIHKSQGKTFEKVVIDMGTGAFSHGQTYVALSRCKTLDGIILNKEIRPSDIIVDPRVIEYYSRFVVSPHTNPSPGPTASID